MERAGVGPSTWDMEGSLKSPVEYPSAGARPRLSTNDDMLAPPMISSGMAPARKRTMTFATE